MAFDITKPATTDAFASVISEIVANFTGQAQGLDPAVVTLTSVPTNAIRWNSASNIWEKYNGSTWAALTATYAISVSGNAATATLASACPWSGITSKPTTLSGYGITDGAPLASPALTGSPTINGNPAGFANIPPVGGAAKTTNYTAVLADAGFGIDMNGSSLTATIPANASVAYPLGTVLTFTNLNVTALSIAITTDTMTKAGSTSTGTRTLAQNGVAVARKVGTTSWLISGTGLT